jgi:hypothetical protein
MVVKLIRLEFTLLNTTQIPRTSNIYSEVEIKTMLEFLIDNVFVVVGDQVFQQSVGTPMGMICAPSLIEMFHIHTRQSLFKSFYIRRIQIFDEVFN